MMTRRNKKVNLRSRIPVHTRSSRRMVTIPDMSFTVLQTPKGATLKEIQQLEKSRAWRGKIIKELREKVIKNKKLRRI